MSTQNTLNAFSVDVEEYFQVSAFEGTIARADWTRWPSRLEYGLERVLTLLDAAQVKATFFTLGWIAERFPARIRQLVACGHELASHGYAHRRATQQTRAEFAQDIRHTKALLEDLSGTAVQGYRAASYSLDRTNHRWAHEELRAAGYRYSSSVYPVRHDLYGIPDAPRFRYCPLPDDPGFVEIPITTLEWLGRRWPIGGGGFFRLYPYAVSRWALARVNRRERQSAMFYCHPWELDPNQPRPPGLNMKTRVRHYLHLDRTEARLRRLLGDFAWDRVDRVFLPAAS